MIDNIGSSIQGLFSAQPTDYVDLGTDSNGDTRLTTPNSGYALVGATVDTPSSFGDWLGQIANGVASNSLVQRYVDGKITKGIINDGVPLYTTYGNPSDQANGKLLQDVAVQQKAAATKTWLIVGGGVLLLAVVYLVARK